MSYRSRLNINLSLLADNFHKLKTVCTKNEVVFMVKADAYGHGVLPIVDFAHHELGVREFGCATLNEAIQLRNEFFDCQFEIYVFSDIQFRENFELYLNRRILPIISNRDDLNFLLKHEDCKNIPLCLEFNTGMNRLGIPFTETQEVIETLKKFKRMNVHHLMTHFSSASLPMDSNKRNREQLQNFKQIKEYFLNEGFELKKTSISNSGAIEQKVGLEESHIRPGLMLYGPSSLLEQYAHKSWWKGKIISSLETYALQTFSVEKGQPIGYGATPCPEKGSIVILPIGYGDGFSNHYGGAEFSYRKKVGKVFGRVNMDMLQLFFKEVSIDQLPLSGEQFLLWNNDPEELSKLCRQIKTIPYELFCGLTKRVSRVYRQ